MKKNDLTKNGEVKHRDLYPLRIDKNTNYLHTDINADKPKWEEYKLKTNDLMKENLITVSRIAIVYDNGEKQAITLNLVIPKENLEPLRKQLMGVNVKRVLFTYEERDDGQ